jgi:hypothetical protein
MTRFIISTVFFAVLAVGVGLLLSGDDEFEWRVAVGLFGLALVGEGVCLWIRRSRAKYRQSSEI